MLLPCCGTHLVAAMPFEETQTTTAIPAHFLSVFVMSTTCSPHSNPRQQADNLDAWPEVPFALPTLITVPTNQDLCHFSNERGHTLAIDSELDLVQAYDIATINTQEVWMCRVMI
jgi:hypothetical protein